MVVYKVIIKSIEKRERLKFDKNVLVVRARELLLAVGTVEDGWCFL